VSSTPAKTDELGTVAHRAGEVRCGTFRCGEAGSARQDPAYGSIVRHADPLLESDLFISLRVSPRRTIGLAKPKRWVSLTMPTVLRKDGFVVKVLGPPREHGPPHVHVQKGRDALVVIRLPIGDQSLKLWKVYEMGRSDVLRAARIVEAHAATLLAAWEEIHGTAPDER
jgi:hypothetical protein